MSAPRLTLEPDETAALGRLLLSLTSTDPERVLLVEAVRRAFERDRPSGETVQVGWVRFNGDEFVDFRYSAPGDLHSALLNAGWVMVYVDADKVPGA